MWKSKVTTSFAFLFHEASSSNSGKNLYRIQASSFPTNVIFISANYSAYNEFVRIGWVRRGHGHGRGGTVPTSGVVDGLVGRQLIRKHSR